MLLTSAAKLERLNIDPKRTKVFHQLLQQCKQMADRNNFDPRGIVQTGLVIMYRPGFTYSFLIGSVLFAVYLVQEETSLTGRNYIYCSGCQHRAFKQFRNVYRASAPEHLKKHGNSDNDLLKFCRNCWFDTKGPITEKHNGLEPSPHFERSSLGITDRRACFGWHFIQRDFARQKFEEQDKSRAVDNDGAILLPLATVVVQNGNDFIEKIDSGSLFDSNGRETSSSTYNCNNEVDFNAESAAEWRGFVHNQQRQQQKLSNERKLLEIVKQIRKDHDYAPSVQKEIEITTTGLSPEKKIAMKSNNKFFNRDFGSGKNYLKIDKNGQQVKKLAKNLISKTQECSTASNEEIQIKMPIEKAAEEIRKMREKGDAIDPGTSLCSYDHSYIFRV